MKINFKKINFLDYFFIFISALLFIYAVYLASTSSYTHDESFTYLVHAKLSLKDIFLYNGPAPANNHLLNTLLVKFFSIFGKNEFFGRLPVLLSYLLYLCTTILFSKKLKSTILQISCFVLLNFNPFLYEFFRLSRGYGLGIGFMMASLYFFQEGIEKEEQRFANWALIIAIFAVISNFAFLSFYIPLAGLGIVLAFQKLRKQTISTKFSHAARVFFQKFGIITGSVFTTFLFTMYPILKLQRNSQLYYGGTKSFWQDTVKSLVNSYFFGIEYSPLVKCIFYAGIAMVLVLTVFGTLHQIAKNGFNFKKSSLLVFGGLILLGIHFNIAQHELLDSRFLINRTALFYVPLFVLLMFQVFQFLITFNLHIVKISIGFVAILLAIFSGIHFLNSIRNPYYSWKGDSGTKDMIKTLISMRRDVKYDTVTLAVNWHVEPSISFYKHIYNLDWLIIDKKGLEKENEFDFYYYSEKEKMMVNKRGVLIIENYPISDYYLARRK